MAQKIQTFFVDDIDGGEAEGTIRFGLDGADYEIDLSGANAAKLRKALDPYIVNGRRTIGGVRAGQRRPPRGKSTDGLDSQAVRDWAKSQGIHVKERGRIPVGVVLQFKAAQGAAAAVPQVRLVPPAQRTAGARS